MTRSHEPNGLASGTQGAMIDLSIATNPSSPQKIPHLVKDIQSHSEAFANGNLYACLQLLEAARSLVQALETPQETMIQHAWVQVSRPKKRKRKSNKIKPRKGLLFDVPEAPISTLSCLDSFTFLTRSSFLPRPPPPPSTHRLVYE